MWRFSTMADTNWNICFICQVRSKGNVRSSTDGYKTLAKNIQRFHKFVALIWTYYQFRQQIKQFITTTVSRSIAIENLNAPTSHLKCGNVQKMKREESRHVCQLNREKDSIYSVVGVGKRILMLIASLQGHIREQN